MKFLSSFFGIAFHPVLLAIPGVFLVVYSSTRSFEESSYWTILSLIFSSIVAIFVIIGVKKRIFNNLDVSNRKQRFILYPFVIGVTLLFALFVYLQNGPSALVKASVLFSIALIILDQINRKIKASVHVASLTAFITGIIFLYGGFTYFLLFLIPFSAWARINQKRHTLSETIAGALLGAGLTIGAIYIVQLGL